MGFLDKVKETTNKVADQAKHATAVGKEKLDDTLLQKKINGLCQDIGALVVALAGEPAAWLDRRGHSLVTFPGAVQDVRWIDALVRLVKDGRVRALEIRKVDGEPVGSSPWLEPLRRAGFADGYKGLTLHK